MLHVCTQYFTCIYMNISSFYSFVLMMLLSPASEKSMRLIQLNLQFFISTALDELSAFLLEDLQHERGQIYALDL